MQYEIITEYVFLKMDMNFKIRLSLACKIIFNKYEDTGKVQSIVFVWR